MTRARKTERKKKGKQSERAKVSVSARDKKESKKERGQQEGLKQQAQDQGRNREREKEESRPKQKERDSLQAETFLTKKETKRPNKQKNTTDKDGYECDHNDSSLAIDSCQASHACYSPWSYCTPLLDHHRQPTP